MWEEGWEEGSCFLLHFLNFFLSSGGRYSSLSESEEGGERERKECRVEEERKRG